MHVTAANAHLYRARSEERDSQRSKLYKAEREVWAGSKRHETIEEVEAFVAKVRGRKVLKDRFKLALSNRIKIGDGRRRRNAAGGRYGIYMPRWSRSEMVILHELAHTITIRLCGESVAAHGWQYANVYLQLVSSMLGREMHDRLKAAFKKHGVRSKPKKKRTVTPQMLEHLANARQLAAAAKAD